MKKIIIAIVLIILFPIPITVFAGGGRILIYTSDNLGGYYSVNSDMYVLAQVFVPDSSNTISSVGERAEFRIENPRAGDACVNEIEQTTELGLLRARCRVSQPGTLTVYVYSFADNYESSRYLLHFYALPSATNIPTQQPTVIPTTLRSTPTPTIVVNNSITTAPAELSPTPASSFDSKALEKYYVFEEPVATFSSEEDLDTNTEDEVAQSSDSTTIVLSLALLMFGICIAGTGLIIFKTGKKT